MLVEFSDSVQTKRNGSILNRNLSVAQKEITLCILPLANIINLFSSEVTHGTKKQRHASNLTSLKATCFNAENHCSAKMAREMNVNCASLAIFAILLLTQNLGCVLSSNWKYNSGRTHSSGHVTKSYPTQGSAGNSRSDLVQLRYSRYNSPPNRPASTAGSGATSTLPIGWNVPKLQGSPASGTNVHTPITGTNTQGVQSPYRGGTYNSPGSVPADATHYSPGSVPVGTTYHSPGSYPARGNPYAAPEHMSRGSPYPSVGVSTGATYVPPGAVLPSGLVLHPSPPQKTSSGLGFGSGLAIGALGGAILHQGLTKTQTRVESAPTASAGKPGGADGKIFIINNGPPGSVTTTNAGGATVITTGVVGENAKKPTPAPGAAPEKPPPGGIICVRVRVNDTDPADSSKMIEVGKIICYRAPPPPPAPVTGASQQLQANGLALLLSGNALVKTSGAGAWLNYAACNSMTTVLLPLFVAFFGRFSHT